MKVKITRPEILFEFELSDAEEAKFKSSSEAALVTLEQFMTAFAEEVLARFGDDHQGAKALIAS
jgi:hypothetical protein